MKAPPHLLFNIVLLPSLMLMNNREKMRTIKFLMILIFFSLCFYSHFDETMKKDIFFIISVSVNSMNWWWGRERLWKVDDDSMSSLINSFLLLISFFFVVVCLKNRQIIFEKWLFDLCGRYWIESWDINSKDNELIYNFYLHTHILNISNICLSLRCMMTIKSIVRRRTQTTQKVIKIFLLIFSYKLFVILVSDTKLKMTFSPISHQMYNILSLGL